MLFEKVPTPCVGICSTTYGDSVCRGCRRYLHEVIDWNRYNDTEKRLIWQRLDNLMQQVLPRYFDIRDSDTLRRQLEHYRIPFRKEATIWGWLYALLKAAAKQEPVLGDFGVWRIDRSDLSLAELREQINLDLHVLATAYYERDLLRASRVYGAPERT
ncbi:MAG: DUF1289 domain-containing protein [Moraxellaceae bacterium]|nr:DUF1289 domain-containing protein [Moraxellaceae bacterium]MDP1775006.1 DUF1289 domain-containing protein [Moraxellaceae bacterium]MDZ4298692.1 DUF1289 domain-containing protein [Moraxellaceae bacterium]MDZ4387911.1 DUF1289 domain-containing protein [Moraxellaceae bacterium]